MDFVVYLIAFAIAVVFAVVCQRIATGKGRSGLLWAALGFVFPLIALIVILLLPEKTAAA